MIEQFSLVMKLEWTAFRNDKYFTNNTKNNCF